MARLTVDDLVHIREIEFLKSRYCRAIDNKEWHLLPEFFVPDARFEGFGGGVITAVSKFVERITKLLEGSITVHHLHHHEIKIVGPTEARGVWALMDYNEWPVAGVLRDAPEATGFCGYGFYEECYRNEEGQWRIEFMRLTRLRVDPLIRGQERINPFERCGLVLPRPGWLEEKAGDDQAP